MKKITLVQMTLLLCLIFPPIILTAQTDKGGNPLIEKLVTSQDWRTRREAVSELNRIPSDVKSDDIRKAFIDELMREYDRLKNGKMQECRDGIDCDDEITYYHWLLEVVADMQDDRVFPFFKKLGSPDTLFRYGDKGIEEILKNIESKNCAEAHGSIHYLAKAVESKQTGYMAKGVMREKIKQKLIESLDKYKHPKRGIEWYEVRARECAGLRLQIVEH